MGMGKDREAFRKRFQAYKDGKSVNEIYSDILPGYRDGKPKGDGMKYSWDDQTQSWTRYTGDDAGDVFADFVVTPRGGAHKKDVEPVQIVTPEQQQYSQRNKPTVSTNSTWHYTPAASTFAGRVVQAAGGDWKSADIASAGASLHPLLSVPLGVMDTGYNLNQSLHDLTDANKHVNTALSAASILPLVGGIKLLKGKDVGTKLLNAYNNYMYSLGNVDDINNTLRNIKYLDSAADATTAMSNIVASPYKYASDQSVTDLFNKMRSMQIRGKLSQIKPTQPTADDPFGIRDLASDVIHHEGMPDGVEDVFRYQIFPRTEINRLDYERYLDILKQYGYNTLDDYNWAKYVNDHTAGYLDNATNAVAIREGYEGFAGAHEFRHRMQRMLPYKRSLHIDRESYLNRAYDDDFVNLPKNVDPDDSLYGYTLMEDEKATTNLDARKYAFNNFTDDANIGKSSVIEQNKFLDSLTDDQILDAVKESNGYGKKYIKFLDDKYHIYNDLKARAKYALRFRNAMKYYGAAAIPVGFGYSTIKPRQNK